MTDRAAATRARVRPRRAGRPRAATAARLPELLLDAAEALFLAHGYGATTVEQIAAHVGATKRTIYVKFGDKEGLFSAMARRVVERRRAWLADEFAAPRVEERLIVFGERLLALALAPDVLALHRAMVAEAYRFPELALLVEQLAAEGATRRLASILAVETARGSLELADPELAAELLVGMIVNSGVQAGLLGRESAAAHCPNSWVRTAISLFLDGCRPKCG